MYSPASDPSIIEQLIVRRRQWQATPVHLPRKSHGQRSLVGCSPWGCYESDRTEHLHFHFSLSCLGEGNGNPLQCSCLENPRNGGACWAAIYGVAQSRTRLKRLSSSSSSGLQAPTCSWLAWSFPSLLLSSLFLDIPTWWFTFYRASSHPHPQGLHIHCPSGLLPEQA